MVEASRKGTETRLSLTDEPAVVCLCPPIRASQVGIRYHDKVVLEDVSLEVSGGSITAIVGPSGCGKTSFLSCINRLSDLSGCCSVTGSLRVGELDVLSDGIDRLDLRRRVGMICQKPNPFPFSIWRNLEFPLREHGVKARTEIEKTIERVLRDVGLWDEVKDRLGSSAMTLSGGQQQRLCIARALCLKPEVLLLDEPCGALDPISTGVVEDYMACLRGRCTLLVVTHNLAQARRIADNVAVFWNREGRGYLLEAGTAEQIFEAPRESLTAAYVRGLRG